MLSPRSLLLAQRQLQRQGHPQHIDPASPTPASPPSPPNGTPFSSSLSSHSSSSTPVVIASSTLTYSPSPPLHSDSLPFSLSYSPSPSPLRHAITAASSFDIPPTIGSYDSTHTLGTSPPTTLPTFTPPRWSPQYEEERKHDVAVTVTPVPDLCNATMGKRKERRETLSLSPSSPPKTTTGLTTRPMTPTSPVKIPVTKDRPTAHPQKRHSSQRSRHRDSRSPEVLPPSVATLLAVTDIPRPRQIRRRRRRDEKMLTVDEAVACQQESEKELSWNLSRSPWDILLSPPQDSMDDVDSVSDCNLGSSISVRTYSMDSIPSLDESFTSDGFSSLETPRTPSPSRRSRFAPMRKSLEPVLSPPGSSEDHPLARRNIDLDEADFTPSKEPVEDQPAKSQFLPFKPLRSVFKSNLTASLRALRSAAKSFSTINFPSIPADDFLTRSILTIDPNVPYTDERRPPVTEDIPSAEMRRYLNPTTNARIESPTKTVAAGTFAASIQMRTYKVQRSRSTPSRGSYPSTSLQSSNAPQQPQTQAPTQTGPPSNPAMRQREMRENCDFIRIAVMEMAMRKSGKLDDQRPGRARWALPPRKTANKAYEVAPDGVPVRWIPITS